MNDPTNTHPDNDLLLDVVRWAMESTGRMITTGGDPEWTVYGKRFTTDDAWRLRDRLARVGLLDADGDIGDLDGRAALGAAWLLLNRAFHHVDQAGADQQRNGDERGARMFGAVYHDISSAMDTVDNAITAWDADTSRTS